MHLHKVIWAVLERLFDGPLRVTFFEVTLHLPNVLSNFIQQSRVSAWSQIPNSTLSDSANKSISVWAIDITPASSVRGWIVSNNTCLLGAQSIRLVGSPVCIQCDWMVAPRELRRVSFTGETKPQAASEVLQIKNNKCCREEIPKLKIKMEFILASGNGLREWQINTTQGLLAKFVYTDY